VFAEAETLGFDVQTRWPSYFAWRLAPLGAVGPRAAASACYSFSPDMVAAHVPAAWTVAAPAQVLAARERSVDRLYRRLFGDLIGSPGLAALQVAGLDPAEALVSFAAVGAAPEEVFASRGWSACDWSAARDRLTARGWIDSTGQATQRGRDARDEVEWHTDRLAELTTPLLVAAFESGLLPSESTLGIAHVPAPSVRG
jgi:hypothetical protein